MAMIAHPVPYEYKGKQYEGRIVYDDSVSEKRPAIYMQPDWLGVCSHTVEMAVDAEQSTMSSCWSTCTAKTMAAWKRPTKNSAGLLAAAGRISIHSRLRRGGGRILDCRSRKDGIDRYVQNWRRRLLHGRGYLTEQIRAGAPYKGSVFIHVTLPMTVAPNRPSTSPAVS